MRLLETAAAFDLPLRKALLRARKQADKQRVFGGIITRRYRSVSFTASSSTSGVQSNLRIVMDIGKAMEP